MLPNTTPSVPAQGGRSLRGRRGEGEIAATPRSYPRRPGFRRIAAGRMTACAPRSPCSCSWRSHRRRTRGRSRSGAGIRDGRRVPKNAGTAIRSCWPTTGSRAWLRGPRVVLVAPADDGVAHEVATLPPGPPGPLPGRPRRVAGGRRALRRLGRQQLGLRQDDHRHRLAHRRRREPGGAGAGRRSRGGPVDRRTRRRRARDPLPESLHGRRASDRAPETVSGWAFDGARLAWTVQPCAQQFVQV